MSDPNEEISNTSLEAFVRKVANERPAVFRGHLLVILQILQESDPAYYEFFRHSHFQHVQQALGMPPLMAELDRALSAGDLEGSRGAADRLKEAFEAAERERLRLFVDTIIPDPSEPPPSSWMN